MFCIQILLIWIWGGFFWTLAQQPRREQLQLRGLYNHISFFKWSSCCFNVKNKRFVSIWIDRSWFKLMLILIDFIQVLNYFWGKHRKIFFGNFQFQLQRPLAVKLKSIYFQMHLLISQWFPNYGPRAKSGPPNQIWPAGRDNSDIIKNLNLCIFLISILISFNFNFVSLIFVDQYSAYLPIILYII